MDSKAQFHALSSSMNINHDVLSFDELLLKKNNIYVYIFTDIGVQKLFFSPNLTRVHEINIKISVMISVLIFYKRR